MTRPVARIADIAYGRLRSPDLDVMEEFLTEFGMVRAARTNNALYMRGTDPSHHLHVTEKGEPGFASVAYLMESEDDLKALAALPDAGEIEEIDEPGGGRRVWLREPNNGFMIEAVHGLAAPAPLPVTPRPLNWSPEILRNVGDPERLQFGPSRVKRLSHAVFFSPRVKETLAWLRATFNFVITDEMYEGELSNVVLSFNRLDHGDRPVDHHVINVTDSTISGLQHLSYEVQDVDDLFVGHNHLRRSGRYGHMMGVGYHPPGGQIYDYWLSPWGQMHEHWIGTRKFTSASLPNLIPAPKEAIDPDWAFNKQIMPHVPA